MGCFNGGFLAPLVQSYNCFGIEINPQAQKEAERRGVTIIDSDYVQMSGKYDFVTAFDVIEHTERPARFVEQCLEATRPNGFVIISTGNLLATSFKLMKSRYWYCTIAEHISFLHERWFQERSSQLGYSLERATNFRHGNASINRRTRELAANLLYRGLPSVVRLIRRSGIGGKNATRHPELADHPPSWASARDHFIVLLRKN